MKRGQILLFLVNALSGMGYSIVSPLFPLLGERGDFGEDLLGFLISVYALSSFFFAPFTPRMCKKFGRINILYVVTFGEATCMLLYGLLSFIGNFYFLIISMFLIRIIHGICAGIVGVLVYSLASSISEPDEIELALGYMEVAWCIGLSGGPLCASVFYHIGGYYLPFIALGTILYISVYFTKLISEDKTESEEEDEQEHSFMKLFFNINILLILGSIAIGVIVNTFYFPCLTNHLTSNYGLSVSMSSLFFVVGLVFYMIFLHCLNTFTNKFGMHGTACMGLVMAAVGALFIYPVRPIPQSLISILIGLCLAGGVGGPLYVTGLLNLSKYIRKIDTNIDDFSANDIASAMYQLINNIGDFVGPIVGGFISKHLGFEFTCVIISLFIFIYLAVFVNHFKETIKYEMNNKNTGVKFSIIKEEFQGNLIGNNDLENSFNSFNDMGVTELMCFRTNCLGRRNSSIKKQRSLNSTLLSNLTK